MSKRIFDFFLSLVCLLLLGWLIMLLIILASINTKSFGLFLQKRVGQHGKLFTIFKIKSMDASGYINGFSGFIRKYKLDELPQLVNIFMGQMSFVGPRPDVPGYYDKLEGEYAKILELKPGLTSEAAILYKNENLLLQNQINSKAFNDQIIFPDKVKLNLNYYYTRNFLVDLQIMLKTLKHFL